jgi:hypothetical protein
LKKSELKNVIKEQTEKTVKQCPAATQDLSLNTANRDRAIQADFIKYGPLNVEEPGDYWEKIAKKWDTDVEAAKKSKCAKCVAFDVSERMLACIPGKTSEPVKDEFGILGYCWMHHFKCHSARSCNTWAAGGPINDNKVSYDWQKRNLKVALDKEPIEAIEENLRNWFKKEDWVRIDTQGNIAGKCGTMKKGKKTQRCLPRAKANSLTKAQRAATSRKKTASNKQYVKNTKKAGGK